MIDPKENNSFETKWNELQDKLKSERNLDVIQSYNKQNNHFEFLKVKDASDQQYLIQVLPITSQEDEKESKELLEQVKQQSQEFQKFQHANISKYHSEFQIGGYYFLQVENVSTTLHDWFQSCQQISRKDLIRIAVELLQVALYLHNRGYALKDVSLKNIFLDSNHSVQIIKFGKPNKVDSSYLKKIQENAIDDEQYILTLPPEILSLEKNIIKKVRLGQQADVWLIGICIYQMAGASVKHLIRFIRGEEELQTKLFQDMGICYIVAYLLSREKQYRPSISQIIQSFKNIQENVGNSNDEDQIQSQKIEIDQQDNYVDILIKGFQFYNSKNYQKALPFFEQVIKLNPRCDVALFKLGNIYNFQKSYEEALKYYNQVIEVNPKYDYAYKNMGQIYQEQKQFELAKQYYVQANELNPLLISDNDMAESLVKMDMIEESIEYFKKSQNQNPHFELGCYYHKEKQYGKSIQYLKKAIEENPQNGTFYSALGKAYIKNKRYDDAIEIIELAKKLNPQSYLHHNELGYVYKQMKKYDLSAKSWRYSIILCGKQDYVPYLNLGKQLYKENQYDEAISILKRGIEVNNQIDTMHFLLSQSYLKINKLEQSLAYGKNVIDLKPNHYKALIFLSGIHSKLKHFHETELTIKIAIKLEPNRGDAYYYYGNFCGYRQNYAKAYALSKKGSKLNLACSIFIQVKSCKYLNRYDKALQYSKRNQKVQSKNQEEYQNLIKSCKRFV